MKIEVLLFAQLKDHFGFECKSFQVDHEMQIGDFVQNVLRLDLQEHKLLYGLNEELVKNDAMLKDRDILALIPPVAGG